MLSKLKINEERYPAEKTRGSAKKHTQPSTKTGHNPEESANRTPANRVIVTDAYQRRCAVTQEKTLPAPEVAQIKPFSESGPHAVSN